MQNAAGTIEAAGLIRSPLGTSPRGRKVRSRNCRDCVHLGRTYERETPANPGLPSPAVLGQGACPLAEASSITYRMGRNLSNQWL